MRSTCCLHCRDNQKNPSRLTAQSGVWDSSNAAMTHLRIGVVIELEVLQTAELAEGGHREVAVELKTAHVHPQQVACRKCYVRTLSR